MMKTIKVPRVVLFIAMVFGMALGGAVDRFNPGIAAANAADPGVAGTYGFTVALNPEDDLLEAFLVDSRTGAVYRGDYDSAEKDIIWRKYVSAKFR